MIELPATNRNSINPPGKPAQRLALARLVKAGAGLAKRMVSLLYRKFRFHKKDPDRYLNPEVRKEARQNKFLESLLNTRINFYVVRTDLLGRYTYINNAYCSRYGYDPAKVIGLSVFSTIQPREMEGFIQAVNRCLDNPGEPFKVTLTKRHRKTREEFTAEWEMVAITDEEGIITHVQGLGQDVTERNRIQDQMTEYRNRLENIMATVDDVIWSISAQDYSTQFVNPAVQRVWGYDPADFYADSFTWFALVMEEDRAKLNEVLEHILVHGAGEAEYRIRHSDGSIRYILSKARLRLDAHGQPSQISGVSIDVTEKRLNQQIILEQNQKLREVAWMQSHVVRASGARIMGLVRIMNRDNPADPENAPLLDMLQQEAVKLNVVTSEVVQTTYALSPEGMKKAEERAASLQEA